MVDIHFSNNNLSLYDESVQITESIYQAVYIINILIPLNILSHYPYCFGKYINRFWKPRSLSSIRPQEKDMSFY